MSEDARRVRRERILARSSIGRQPGGDSAMQEKRLCRRCQCHLSLYNTDELCSSCSRTSERPKGVVARIPSRVWADPAVREALAAFDFGRVSRLVREQGSIRQEDLAALTGLSQGFLSMLESGDRRLTNIDRIVEFLDGLAVPADLVRMPRRLQVPRNSARTIAACGATGEA